MNVGKTSSSCSTNDIIVLLLWEIDLKAFESLEFVFIDQFLMTTVAYLIAESDIIHDSSFQNIFPNKKVYSMGSFHLAKQIQWCKGYYADLYIKIGYPHNYLLM